MHIITMVTFSLLIGCSVGDMPEPPPPTQPETDNSGNNTIPIAVSKGNPNIDVHLENGSIWTQVASVANSTIIQQTKNENVTYFATPLGVYYQENSAELIELPNNLLSHNPQADLFVKDIYFSSPYVYVAYERIGLFRYHTESSTWEQFYLPSYLDVVATEIPNSTVYKDESVQTSIDNHEEGIVRIYPYPPNGNTIWYLSRFGVVSKSISHLSPVPLAYLSQTNDLALDIIISEDNSSLVFVLTQDHLWKSSNGGASFTDVSIDYTRPSRFKGMSLYQDSVYLIHESGGISVAPLSSLAFQMINSTYTMDFRIEGGQVNTEIIKSTSPSIMLIGGYNAIYATSDGQTFSNLLLQEDIASNSFFNVFNLNISENTITAFTSSGVYTAQTWW